VGGMFYKYVISFFFILAFISCSSSPQPEDGSNEQFAKKAILIEYSSSKDLNMYDNETHVIPLVVYQLNDRNSFDSLKKDKNGILKLLQAKKFDKSVMSVDKYYISPNETKKLFLNRASKTVWVAFVAGYYNMQVSQSTLIYKIPSYSSWKFWSSKSSQKFLKVKLFFNKSSIEQREE
jgi:type VI secretion system VasD/TssJ family lipoprotein